MSTTFPIDVTVDRLIEFTGFAGTIRQIGLAEIGRDVFAPPSPTPDDAVGAIMLQMALEGQTGAEIQAWLHDTAEAEAWRARPPDPEPVPEPPVPLPGDEIGEIVIDRPAMRDDVGDCWQWRGFTDFLLFLRWLQEGPSAALEALVSERLELGVNVVRVLGMVDSFAHLWPQEQPTYYGELRPFVQWLAGHGLRVEFVVFADAQIIMPHADDRQRHLTRVLDALDPAAGGGGFEPVWNVFIEIANEPFKNLPGGDPEATDLALSVKGTTELLIASGAYTAWPPAATADYGTTHCERSDDWPRKCKDQKDLCDNSDQTPWIGDEPMGASETLQPGKRDTNPDHFAWYASGSQMFSPGATFHCDDGINSISPIGPTQRACALAFFWALGWTPKEALLWPYQRGDMGSEAGIGNMPILHDDALETRSYAKSNGGQSWAIQIQTKRVDANGNYTPTPRDGWRVVSTPRLGFCYLEKP